MFFSSPNFAQLFISPLHTSENFFIELRYLSSPDSDKWILNPRRSAQERDSVTFCDLVIANIKIQQWNFQWRYGPVHKEATKVCTKFEDENMFSLVATKTERWNSTAKLHTRSYMCARSAENMVWKSNLWWPLATSIFISQKTIWYILVAFEAIFSMVQFVFLHIVWFLRGSCEESASQIFSADLALAVPLYLYASL